MIILAIRTDNEMAEVGLFTNQRQLAYHKWQAHRQLAETINLKIDEILKKSSINLDQVQGIAVFKGPGSFTGLRIGLSVANSLAYSLSIPIVTDGGEDWLAKAVKKLKAGKDEKIVHPYYGRPARVSLPKKH
jgi:tRNA threonylcarbamoyladenosine biosynthesis protein TsaB